MSARSAAPSCKPRPGAYTPPNTAEVDRSRAELEKLFGKR